jgi:hypothetical protein
MVAFLEDDKRVTEEKKCNRNENKTQQRYKGHIERQEKGFKQQPHLPMKERSQVLRRILGP